MSGPEEPDVAEEYDDHPLPLASRAAATRLKLNWHEALLSDRKLSKNAKVVAGWLLHRFDGRTLQVQIAVSTIAEDLGCSEATITRAIAVLRRRWLLVGKGRFANRYELRSKYVEAYRERSAIIRRQRNERRAASWAQAGINQKCQSETVNSEARG